MRTYRVRSASNSVHIVPARPLVPSTGNPNYSTIVERAPSAQSR